MITHAFFTVEKQRISFYFSSFTRRYFLTVTHASVTECIQVKTAETAAATRVVGPNPVTAVAMQYNS